MDHLSHIGNLVTASFLCTASIIEFTIPQVINLSHKTDKPLPRASLFPHRMAMQANMAPLQTGLTVVQFAAVRELRKLLDSLLGPSRLNLSLAYGAASVPLIAAKYNMIISGVYRYNGRPAPHADAVVSYAKQAKTFWMRRIQPGLLWSYLRDSGSVGGGIVVGKIVSEKLASSLLEQHPDDSATGPTAMATFGIKFAGGLVSGSICGLATHTFHNAALMAGRMTEAGMKPSNFECMSQLIAEQGWKACYMNFPLRVAIIAFWSAVLTIAEPFEY